MGSSRARLDVTNIKPKSDLESLAESMVTRVEENSADKQFSSENSNSSSKDKRFKSRIPQRMCN